MGLKMNKRTSLTPFSLTLTPKYKKLLKLTSVLHNKYQYQIIDDAITWSVLNKNNVRLVGKFNNASPSSYYLSENLPKLEELAAHWNCNLTKALRTCIVSFLDNQSAHLRVS